MKIRSKQIVSVYILIAILLAAGLGISGCRKENDAIPAPKTASQATTPGKVLSASGRINLPENSTAFSFDLAADLLEISITSGADRIRSVMNDYGFSVLEQNHYGKADDTPEHTAGFTIGVKKESNLLLVAIRETASSGEWQSNFDIAPSHSDDVEYAENFLACATDVYQHLLPYLSEYKDPSIIVCGYSRGAAAGNLLGILLDKNYDAEKVYVYTFATPATVRGNAANQTYDNIFNIVNPNDLITMLPPVQWGFSRAGTDIVLAENPAIRPAMVHVVETLSAISPTISSYYNDRHSRQASGLSHDGITVAEIFPLFVSGLSGDADLSALKPLLLMAPDSDLNPIRQLIADDLLNSEDKLVNRIALQHGHDTYRKLLYDAYGQ